MDYLVSRNNIAQFDLENAQNEQYFKSEYMKIINYFFHAYEPNVTNLVAEMSEAQMAYLKYLQIASQHYNSDAERWDAVLKNLSAKEFAYVQMFSRGDNNGR